MKQWGYKEWIEKRYQRELRALGRELTSKVSKAKTIEEAFEIAQEFQHKLMNGKYADFIANQMVSSIVISTQRDMNQSLRKNASSTMYKTFQEMMQTGINDAIQAELGRNSRLIKTLPTKISERITHEIQKQALKGIRSEDISKEMLSKFGHISKVEADLIARTETAKAQGALVKARSQSIGLNWYIWRDSSDGRVRLSHKRMEGIICNFNNPPIPEAITGEQHTYGAYNPGGIFNCRCYAEVIVDISDIKFPTTLCSGGTSVFKVNKSEFLAMM